MQRESDRLLPTTQTGLPRSDRGEPTAREDANRGAPAEPGRLPPPDRPAVRPAECATRARCQPPCSGVSSPERAMASAVASKERATAQVPRAPRCPPRQRAPRGRRQRIGAPHQTAAPAAPRSSGSRTTPPPQPPAGRNRCDDDPGPCDLLGAGIGATPKFRRTLPTSVPLTTTSSVMAPFPVPHGTPLGAFGGGRGSTPRPPWFIPIVVSPLQRPRCPTRREPTNRAPAPLGDCLCSF